jgi:hypothetical protein
MSQLAKITTRAIGVHFACDAIVELGSYRAWTSPDYPHGARSVAHSAAVAWCARHGHWTHASIYEPRLGVIRADQRGDMPSVGDLVRGLGGGLYEITELGYEQGVADGRPYATATVEAR